MGKYKIVFSTEAKKDIDEIIKYLRNSFGSLEFARRYCNELLLAIKSLELFPNRFEMVKMKYIKRDDIRKMLYRNYLIFYHIDENGKNVIVLRIRHGLTDWKKN